jgi:hypothetical protein
MLRRITRAVVLSLLIGIGAQSLSAEFRVKEYQALKESSDPAQKALLEEYINGVGQGISWANSYLHSTNRQRLYCAPENLALNADNYEDMLDRHIAKLAKTVTQEKLDGSFIGLVLLRALIETFPCKVQK